MCFSCSLTKNERRETETKNKLCNFAKLKPLNDKIQKKHFALGNLAKFVFWTILSSKNWTLAKLLCFFQLYIVVLRRNLGPKNCLISSHVSSKKNSHEWSWDKKSWAILQIFNSWMIKFSERRNLSNCRVPNVFFLLYHLRVEVFQNCSAFLSLMRCFFEGMRENI